MPVRLFATLVHDQDGAPQNIAAFVVDLTDQKRAEDALRCRETLFQALLERASDVAVVNAPDGTVLYANTTVTSFGYSPDQVLGQPGFDFVHPEDRGLVERAFTQVQRRPEEALSLLYRHHHADGGFRWVEAWLSNRTEDPRIGGIVINLRDVTSRVESDRALQESQERYSAIVETAQEGIWVANPQGRTVYVNQKMADIAGHPIEQLYARGSPGPPGRRRRHHDEPTPPRAANHRDRGLRAPLPASGRHVAMPQGLRQSALRCRGRVPRVARHGLRHHRDETSGASASAPGFYDHLTRLPNRTLLQDRLEQAKERHARSVTDSVAVVFLDVDQFKLVNDSVGHAAGDLLLWQLAGRLQAAALPGETLARVGGDEFVVLTEGLTPEQTRALARRMLAALAEPFDIAGRTMHVTASVGIASSAVCPPEELLQAADAAMYVAKRRGRGETQMYDVSLAAEARTRFDLNVELRSALSEEQLELWYQPIVEIATGAPRHRGPGAVEPPDPWFRQSRSLRLDRRAGRLRPDQLDRWVLRRAAADLAELRAGGHVAPDVYVSVNVSALHLTRGDLWTAVSEAAWLADLPPSCLGLEVTETAVMADPESASAVLRRIADDGFGVALDDFGTGYSSLAYLRNLPVSSVKIDRSFVVDAAGELPTARSARASSLCVVSSASAPIAEGVETQAQQDMLRSMGCPAGQGYRWGRPMPKETLVPWLARSTHTPTGAQPLE